MARIKQLIRNKERLERALKCALDQRQAAEMKKAINDLKKRIAQAIAERGF
jgi:hypothetical protein